MTPQPSQSSPTPYGEELPDEVVEALVDQKRPMGMTTSPYLEDKIRREVVYDARQLLKRLPASYLLSLAAQHLGDEERKRLRDLITAALESRPGGVRPPHGSRLAEIALSTLLPGGPE